MRKTVEIKSHLIGVIALTAFATTFIVSCNPADSSNQDNAAVHSDSDGLTDAEEARYGTSPILNDTDGDGFSDFQEVAEYGFNSENNNYRFNPLIADVAKISIEITSLPKIRLNYQDESGSLHSTTSEHSEETGNITTTSDTSSNSHAIEETHEAGVEVTVGGSVTDGFSASGTVSYDYSHATTNESSVSYTEEQSAENRTALSNAETLEASNNLTEIDGELAVSLRIHNNSELAFQLDSLLLGAVTLNGGDRRGTEPVGNLDIDTEFEKSLTVTLPPRGSTGDLIFNTSLPLGLAKQLLRDSHGLIVNVANSGVSDANGVAFAFRETEIRAKTATVIIDYSGYKPSERYLVATNVDRDTGRISLQDTLDNILKIPYSLNSYGSMDVIRGIASDSGNNAFWVTVHSGSNGIEQTATTFSSEANNGSEFQNLTLKSGDVIQFTYLEDLDGDGLGLRSEQLFGTDPEKPDTDDDGLSDNVELDGFNLAVTYHDASESFRVRTNPLVADSDSDGLLDSEECDMSTAQCHSNPQSADSDRDRIIDYFDSLPSQYSNIDLVTFEITQTDITQTDMVSNLTFQGAQVTGLDDAVVYKVWRQEATTSGELCDYGVGDIACDEDYDDISGLLVVVDAQTAQYTLADSTALNRHLRYQVVMTVNGSEELLLQQKTLDSFPQQKKITVTLQSINYIDCIDVIPILDADYAWAITQDLVCELFGELSVQSPYNNQPFYVGTKSKPIEVQSGLAVSLDSDSYPPLIFSVPDIAGECIYIKPRFWEKEYDNVIETHAYDDRLVKGDYTQGVVPNYGQVSSRHCSGDWRTGTHTVSMAYNKNANRSCANCSLLQLVEFASVSPYPYSEKLWFDLVYTVTVEDL